MTSVTTSQPQSQSPLYILKTYVIHDENLRFREPNMNNTLKTLRIACDTLGIRFKPIMITKPTIDILQKDIQTLQTKVKYEQINDPDFDNRMTMLCMEQISNIEKHKEVWKRIVQDEDKDVVHLVLEDDTYIMQNFHSNLIELLKSLPDVLLSQKRSWDICFLGNTKQVDQTFAAQYIFGYTDTKTTSKILPSKETYIISPHIVKRLLNSCEIMRYTMRIFLSWFVSTNQDIRSVFPTKPVFLDGSKIGLCTSTIHPINPLVLNKEFMEMWHFQNKSEVTLQQIRSAYKKIEYLKSPDIMYLYAKLLMEKKEYQDADDIFLEAIKIMRLQHGILGAGSPLLNDAIENYRNLQKDLHNYIQKSTKYVDPIAE